MIFRLILLIKNKVNLVVFDTVGELRVKIRLK